MMSTSETVFPNPRKLPRRHYYSHFNDEETGAQEDYYITWPIKSQSQISDKLVFEPRPPWLLSSCFHYNVLTLLRKGNYYSMHSANKHFKPNFFFQVQFYNQLIGKSKGEGEKERKPKAFLFFCHIRLYPFPASRCT